MNTKMKVMVCAVMGQLLCMGCGTVNGGKAAFPVTRVTMYDCGLAQWERETEVHGAQRLEIPVTRAHLDDLLASLALATDGGVKVRSVRFPSVKTMSQAEEASSLGQRMMQRRENGEGGLSTAAGYAQMLVGVPVRVQRASGSELVGTVMGVTSGDGPFRQGGDAEGKGVPVGDDQLVLMMAGGGMTWVPMGNVVGLFPLSEEEAVGMQELAGSMGRSRGLEGISVLLETSPDSSGRLGAAHIRQSPLWRISYRVTAREGKILVEMWALVHNDSPEDWKEVTLTLLSGLPRSYVLSLASPRYSQREVLMGDDEGTLSPQLGAKTPDELVFGEEAYDVTLGGSVGYGVGGGSGSGSYAAGGYGHVVRSSAGVVASGPMEERASGLLEVGVPAAEETAEPEVSKEIATYTAMLPVTIPHGTSGLVPLMRRELPGQVFGLVPSQGGAPETCVRVENTSGLVLQKGTASFYVAGRFRGQELLERTQPGDVRVWCFGQDPDVTASVSESATYERRLLEWNRSRGLLVHSVKTVTRNYVVRNDAGQERQIALRIPMPANSRLVEPAEALEGEGNERIHTVDVASRTEWVGSTVVEEAVMASSEMTVREWKELVAVTGIPEEQKAVLRKAMPKLEQKEKNLERYSELTVALSKAEERLATCREDLQAIPAGVGNAPIAPLVKALTAASEEVAKLKTSLTVLQRDNDELAKQIQSILMELKAGKNTNGSK